LRVKTDVENELLGLSRHLTKCPELKFDPNTEFKTPNFSAARLCQSIYQITPNNLEKPTTNMLNEKNLGINFCSSEK
jgi:hypothetical protein